MTTKRLIILGLVLMLALASFGCSKVERKFSISGNTTYLNGPRTEIYLNGSRISGRDVYIGIPVHADVTSKGTALVFADGTTVILRGDRRPDKIYNLEMGTKALIVVKDVSAHLDYYLQKTTSSSSWDKGSWDKDEWGH